jgi:AcrR family transcriptional regulator
LISVETIYDGTLRVLDAEGADGLKARNLAARLHCSTRTLYEQVGNCEALIRGLVAHAFAVAWLIRGTETMPALPGRAAGLRIVCPSLRLVPPCNVVPPLLV